MVLRNVTLFTNKHIPSSLRAITLGFVSLVISVALQLEIDYTQRSASRQCKQVSVLNNFGKLLQKKAIKN